jgi:hypothetical protein
MFFDRDEEGREMLREAVRQRPAGVAPLEALCRLAHRLVAEKSPVVEFSARSERLVPTVAGSETLKARARAIRDDLADLVAAALAEAVGRDAADPDARLAASLLLAAWTVAFLEAHRTFRETRSRKEADDAFLALVDKGATGLKAAMAGTPYL